MGRLFLDVYKLAAIGLCAHCLFGQALVSVGVKGGFPVTDAFARNSPVIPAISINPAVPVVRTGDFLPPVNVVTTGQLSIPALNAVSTFPSPICGPSLPCTPLGGVAFPLGTVALPIPPVPAPPAAPKNFVVGPTVEVRLPLGFSVEADALYRRVSRESATFGPGNFSALAITYTAVDYQTWEFPIVGKYRFPAPVLRPYVEAGPSFRALPSPLNRYWAKAGITAGIGAEAKLGFVRPSAEIRYTYWGKDSGGAFLFYASRHNQAEVLLGIIF